MTSAPDAEFSARLARALGDGYELRDRLGQGGFAVVYAAFDRQLKRGVAVKVLRDELRDVAAVRERFRREAEAVARLRHPHVMPIYAVGEREQVAYFIMPLVDGESLRARLDRERRLPVPDVRRILRECAAGLAAAHRAGLVHRDIKPDNIMLDGPDARVLLTDFGIAKAAEGGGETLTQSGVIVGTPQYMSPEQASGDRAIDLRSDLYSLGVVAYQMLAGDVPFSGTTVASVLVKHISEDAPSVMRARPDCPSDLAAAVARLLEKDPLRRWGSADDLGRALAEDTGPAAPRRSSGTQLAADPLRRFRWTLGLSAAGLAVAAAVDLAADRVLVAPLVAVAGVMVVAAAYGRLWTAGFGWADVFGRRGARAGGALTPLDSLEYGPHRDAIRTARNDRSAVVALVQRWPKAERPRVAAVTPALDQLVARAGDTARQLYALERQVDPGPEEIARRITATQSEPPSPGRTQRLALLERRRVTIAGLLDRQAAIAAALAAELAAVAGLRTAMERVSAGGSGEVEALDAALAAAAALGGPARVDA
ncbi:MAG TPA: serine/threonine-protein kinase [Gemmatimonadales bacterium]